MLFDLAPSQMLASIFCHGNSIQGSYEHRGSGDKYSIRKNPSGFMQIVSFLACPTRRNALNQVNERYSLKIYASSMYVREDNVGNYLKRLRDLVPGTFVS